MTKQIIGLVGNPNCGKTTLFNSLTGANQRVGNWPGVTVERKEGKYTHDGLGITIVDFCREFILLMPKMETPDSMNWWREIICYLAKLT